MRDVPFQAAYQAIAPKETPSAEELHPTVSLPKARSFFGDPDPRAGSPRDKGARLAKLVAQERSLLILDGLEPLQYPPVHQGGLAGQLTC